MTEKQIKVLLWKSENCIFHRTVHELWVCETLRQPCDCLEPVTVGLQTGIHWSLELITVLRPWDSSHRPLHVLLAWARYRHLTEYTGARESHSDTDAPGVCEVHRAGVSKTCRRKNFECLTSIRWYDVRASPVKSQLIYFEHMIFHGNSFVTAAEMISHYYYYWWFIFFCLFREAGVLEPVPAPSEQEAGYTLDHSITRQPSFCSFTTICTQTVLMARAPLRA